MRAKVVKNKVAPPFRVAEFDMMHTNGISYEGDILDLAMAQKLVARTGAWFRYGDMQLGQGREKARDYLKENPQIAEEIKQKIMAAGGMEDMVASKGPRPKDDDDSDAGRRVLGLASLAAAREMLAGHHMSASEGSSVVRAASMACRAYSFARAALAKFDCENCELAGGSRLPARSLYPSLLTKRLGRCSSRRSRRTDLTLAPYDDRAPIMWQGTYDVAFPTSWRFYP